MKSERISIPGDGFDVPAIVYSPPQASCAALIVHGYGGCKEEQLGLAWRIAETGITTCAVDLRGHGEHALPLDARVGLDVTSAIRYCRSFGRVIAVGHSLGGRLVLLSDADLVIAVSPALATSFSAQTVNLIKDLRSYRVREEVPISELFTALPLYKPVKERPAFFVYGGRDVPEIQEGCGALQGLGEDVIRIDKGLHADIFLLEPTIQAIKARIAEWLRSSAP